MKIRDILAKKGSGVVTIEAHKTVHDAICKLNEHGIGSLIVADEAGKIGGIITERDILRYCGENCVRLDQPAVSTEDVCPASAPRMARVGHFGTFSRIKHAFVRQSLTPG